MISIIIPCYNASPTVRTTINSVLSQACPDKEIIVIDDGSTDRSAEIIKSFGDAIVAEFWPNQGASAARNQGTKRARGKYVQYVDADDILMPGTLEERLEALERTGGDVAYTDWQQFMIGPDGVIRPGNVIAQPLNRLGNDPEAACACSTFWAPPAAILYRRWVVDAIGEWNTRLPVIQDARFIFDAARVGARFTHIDGIGALYRVSGDSLSRRSSRSFIKDCFVNALEIEAIWRKDGKLTDTRREALVQIWTYLATSTYRTNLPEFGEAVQHLSTVSKRSHLDLKVRTIVSSVIGRSAAWTIERTIRRLLRPGRQLSRYLTSYR
jgi:glycosyltransferase involved in cell wall biosynthesis